MLKAPSLVQVFDALGTFVLQENNSNEIDVSSLQSGLYFLRIQYGTDEIITEKFIKK